MANKADESNKSFIEQALWTVKFGVTEGLKTAFGGPTSIVPNTNTQSQRILDKAGLSTAGEMTRSIDESALPDSVKGAARSAAVGLDAFEAAQRGINTGVAGTLMLAGGATSLALDAANGQRGMSYANPLFRDGIQMDDVADTYKKVWEGEVTPGQAMALNTGRTALNIADFITGGQSQKIINDWIIEDSRRKIEDPRNERGLLSWASGLHSEFDIYDPDQNDSAFNQGVGRWITGASDAAIMWWAAPDIIVAKGAAMVGRKFFTESITSFDDVQKVATDLAVHQAAKNGERTIVIDGVEVKTKKTAVGRMVDDLATINDERVAVEHAFAKMSSNKTLVAQVIAESKSSEEMGLALRAMLGDMSVMAQVRDSFSATVVDGLSLKRQQVEAVRDILRLGNELESVKRFGPGFDGRAAQLQQQMDDIAIQNDMLAEQVLKNADLADALQASKGSFSTTGISAVRFGTQSKKQTIRLSKFQAGVNSPEWMRRQAEKAATKKAGKLFTEKSFKTPGGRTIRVLRAAGDYMTTYRAMGRIQISRNSDDLYDEIASILTTNPVLRRFMRLAPEDRLLPNIDNAGRQVGGFEDIDKFREYWLNQAVAASSPTERFEVAMDFQRSMLNIIRGEYGVSASQARRLVDKYQLKRQGISEQMDKYGWFNDGTDIIAVPDLQSKMGESIEILDFDFIENVLRLEKGGDASYTLSKLKLGNNSSALQRARMSYEKGIIANIDAFWRPLVLMRLGYTQRNVAEGMLRELAAYDSLGIMVDRDKAIKADPNMSFMERFGYRVNQFENSFVPTVFSPTKRSLRRHTQSLNSVLEELTYFRGEVEARRIMVERAQALADSLAAGAEKQAQKNLAREAKERAQAYADATWTTGDDLARGEMGQMMENAKEIIIPAQYVKPLYQTQGGPRSKSVSGFEDELDATLQPQAQSQGGVLDTLDDYMGMEEIDYASMSKWVPESDQPRLAEVIYSDPGTPEYEEYLDLMVDASFRAMAHAGRRQHAVVRVRGDGRYDVIQSRDEVTIGDLQNGKISVLPKENFENVEAVRAKVYGDVLDLRYLTDDAPEYANVNEALADFWIDFEEYGLKGERLDLIEDALEVLESNPELVPAVNLGRAIMRLKQSHPEIYELAQQKKLLSYSKEFKKSIDRARKSQKNSKETKVAWEAERDEFITLMEDPEFLETIPELEQWTIGEGGELTFHGGSIKDDVIREPAVTEQSVHNLHGSAYLYATGEQWMGAEYAIVKAAKEVGEDAPVKLYMVDHPYSKENFIDLDGTFIDPETGIPNEDVTADAAKWLDSVMMEAGIDEPFEEAFDEVNFIMQDIVDRKAFDDNIDPEPMNMGHFRDGMEEWLLRIREGAPTGGESYAAVDRGVESTYAVQETIRNASLEMGAVGMRHAGGKNFPSVVKGFTEHPVYIYFEPPTVTPIESLTPEIMRLRTLKARHDKAFDNYISRDSVSDYYAAMAPYDIKKWDASEMSPRTMDIITDLANEAGYGSVIATDTLAPSGRRVITRPNQMSIGVDNPDDVIPGQMLEKDYIDRVFPELQHANLLDQASVFKGRDVDELTSMIGNREAADWIIAGGRAPSELSTEARAAIARAMEPTEANPGYSHVSIGDGSKIYSVSQIMGGKKFGSIYGAMLDKSDLEQESVRLLKSNDNWDNALTDLQEHTREYNGLKDQIDQAEAQAKEIADKLKKLNKKLSRKNPNRGFGKERFRAIAGANEFDMDGPFADGLYADLASSESRNRMILFGLSDVYYRDLVRGTKEITFRPGDEQYFLKVADQLNRLYRRDIVAEMMLKNPEWKDDNTFVEVLPDIIEELSKSERGRAWLRDQGGVEEFKGLVDQEILRDDAFDQATEAISKIRTQLDELLPDDADLWRRIGDGDVSSVDLMSDAGWRSDWGNVLDYEMILKKESGYRKIVSKAMRTLGTVPEDHLVRHPFYRARWREDMTRQVELYAVQKRKADPDWDGYFTDNELSQMSLVSKQYALKAVNETLYTITRISTPAHMMKFISPFFPAWASTSRFWLMRMPLQKPENVIRYSYVFDSPASIGALEDRDGNKVDSSANPFNRILNKFKSDDANQIVIQVEGPARTWMEENGIPLTRVGISRGSLDMMLQGDTFWLPGFGPMLTMPLNWAASLMPDVAEAFKTGHITNGANETVDSFVSNSALLSGITKAIYDSTLPFGPSKEKSPEDLVIEAFAPGAAANVFKGIRGTSSASFSNTAQSIYRDKIYNWDLNGRTGPEPRFQDAVAETQKFFWWRVGISLGAPFAPQFQSENQVYVNEWRAIEQETYDAGGTYTDAMDRFIGTYGQEFFVFTQSLSAGSSGVSAKVGEYKEVTGNMDMYSTLAGYGDDGSYMTMASRGVADWSYDPSGFDPAVYAWQFNRSIEGAPGKFFRSGSNQRTDMLQDVDRQAGWYNYNKLLTPYRELFENGELDQDTYSLIKNAIVADLGSKYQTWFEEFGSTSKSRNIQSAKALEDIVSNEQYMTQHGGTTYVRAITEFRNFRNGMIQLLLERERNGGSKSMDAKSNADIAAAYRAYVYGMDEEGMPRLQSQLKVSDPSGEAFRMVERFFGENDPLTPIPGKDY